MPSIQRRTLLGTVASATAAGLAGCAFGFGGTPTTVDVFVRNEDDATLTVDVVVTFAGETLLDEQFVVDPDEQQAAVFSNPDETGDATVSATVEGGGSAEREVAAGAGSGLSSVTVEVGQDGTVETWAAVR